MARYKLRSNHVIGGGIVPAGTEVGEGTSIPFDDIPSNQMEGVDDEGIANVNHLHQQLYGKDAPWHSKEAMEQQKAEREEYEKQQKDEEKKEPVEVTEAKVASPSLTHTTQPSGPGMSAPGAEEPTKRKSEDGATSSPARRGPPLPRRETE